MLNGMEVEMMFWLEVETIHIRDLSQCEMMRDIKKTHYLPAIEMDRA